MDKYTAFDIESFGRQQQSIGKVNSKRRGTIAYEIKRLLQDQRLKKPENV